MKGMKNEKYKKNSKGKKIIFWNVAGILNKDREF